MDRERKGMFIISMVGFVGVLGLLPTGARGNICGRQWCDAVNYEIGPDASGVVAGYFDGDRLADLAVTSVSPDKVGLLKNVGGGSFATPVEVLLAGGSEPHSLAAADFDNDGDLDLVVTRRNLDDVQLLLNTGGAFSLGAVTGVGGTDPKQVVSGDLDANGFADVVTLDHGSASLSVLLNSGGVLAAPVTYAVGSDPRGLALGYLDDDGGLDLAVTSHGDRRIELYLNDGTGAFVAGSTLSVGSELRPDGVAIGDLDSDGVDDVAGSASGSAGDFVAVFMNSGSADFGTASYYDSGGVEPSAIVIADFDFRLGNDVAVTNADFYDKFGALVGTSNVAVLNNLGGGDFGLPRDIEVGVGAEALAAFDVVNTGAQHLITANRDDGTLSVVKNNYVLLASGFEWGDTYPWSATVPAMPWHPSRGPVPIAQYR